MENVEIARMLQEYADLLDIQGESLFRVRAYRKAAQTLEGLSRPVAQLIDEEEDLTQLPGIGTRMAEHIREILATGRLVALEEIRQEFPHTLATLVRVDAIGPKRARQLYDELGITSVPELAVALDSGQVEELSRFGKKTVENLRRAIQSFARHAKRVLLADADHCVGLRTCKTEHEEGANDEAHPQGDLASGCRHPLASHRQADQ